MAPSKRGCPPAGETSVPGHVVPPECASWVSANTREPFAVSRWPANHHLGNPNPRDHIHV